MATIKQLQQNGDDIYPVTKTNAVYADDNKTSIADYIENLTTSTTEDVTLSASSWSDATYTISSDKITATSNQEIIPATSITADQYKALASAMIVDSGQVAGSLTLTALGTVPTIDIPVRVIYRGTI